MERKKKEFKKIDIEMLVIKVAIISNLIIWVILILNWTIWHSSLVSAYTTGWNLCSIAMMLAVDIAGNKNFKHDMKEFDRHWEELHKRLEVELNGEEELQSSSEQDTTNDDK